VTEDGIIEISTAEISLVEVRISIWMQYSPSVPVSYIILKQRNIFLSYQRVYLLNDVIIVRYKPGCKQCPFDLAFPKFMAHWSACNLLEELMLLLLEHLLTLVSNPEVQMPDQSIDCRVDEYMPHLSISF
jgi:hypothetical protein